jgi:hypothetical protein
VKNPCCEASVPLLVCPGVLNLALVQQSFQLLLRSYEEERTYACLHV